MPLFDEYDQKILRILQNDGKISMQELADRVALSISPCWRRVRKLEAAGIITGYVALLDRRKLGLNTLAYVHVSLTDHKEETIALFDEFVAGQDQVVECCSITGADDYLLKIVADDPEGLERFHHAADPTSGDRAFLDHAFRIAAEKISHRSAVGRKLNSDVSCVTCFFVSSTDTISV